MFPHQSYIYIEGRVEVQTVDEAEPANKKVVPNFVNNAAGFLFDERTNDIRTQWISD